MKDQKKYQLHSEDLFSKSIQGIGHQVQNISESLFNSKKDQSHIDLKISELEIQLPPPDQLEFSPLEPTIRLKYGKQMHDPSKPKDVDRAKGRYVYEIDQDIVFSNFDFDDDQLEICIEDKDNLGSPYSETYAECQLRLDAVASGSSAEQFLVIPMLESVADGPEGSGLAVAKVRRGQHSFFNTGEERDEGGTFEEGEVLDTSEYRTENYVELRIVFQVIKRKEVESLVDFSSLAKHENEDPTLLHVTIMYATDLRGVSTKGGQSTANPYTEVAYGTGADHQKHKTQYKPNTLNPEWKQQYTFILDRANVTPLELKVRSKNIVVLKDDDIGEVTISKKGLELIIDESYTSSKPVQKVMNLDPPSTKGFSLRKGAYAGGLERGKIFIKIEAVNPGDTLEATRRDFKKNFNAKQGTEPTVLTDEGAYDSLSDVGSVAGSDEGYDTESGSIPRSRSQTAQYDSTEGIHEVDDDESEKLKKIHEHKLKESMRLMETVHVNDGDYTVQVHLIELRDLIPHGNDGSADPQVKIDCFGQTQYSPIRKNTNSCSFDLYFFFTLKDMERDSLEAGEIVIGVYDTQPTIKYLENTIRRRGPLIGQWTTDFSYLYYRPHHEVYRQWVGLVDETEQVSINGYMLVSVSFLGPGETPKIHDRAKEKEQEAADANDPEKMQKAEVFAVDIPKSLQTLKYLVITVYRGKDLPAMDRQLGVGKRTGTDPFVRILFGDGNKAETKVKNKVQADPGGRCDVVHWNEQLWLPFMWPTMNSRILVMAFDKDGRNEELIGKTQTFQFSMIEHHPDRFKGIWCNIYGAPLEGILPQNIGKMNKMNMTNSTASTYRGRLLLSLRVDDGKRKKHSSGKTKIRKSKIYKKYVNPNITLDKKKYVLKFCVFGGSELPQKGGGLMDEKMKIQVTIGAYHHTTAELSMGNGLAFYPDSKLEVVPLEVEFPSDAHQIPDIIIYLVVNKVNRCFMRIPAKQLLSKKFEDKPRWYPLQEDKVINQIDERKQNPGFLLMNLWMGPKEEDTTWENISGELTHLEEYYACIHVFQAQNLPPADSTGLCDPYVKVKFAGTEGKLETKFKTRNPHFYETIELKVKLPREKSFMPQFVVQLWDCDFFPGGATDDFLGAVRRPVEDATFMENDEVDPQLSAFDQLKTRWYLLGKERPGDVQGSILLAFELVKGWENYVPRDRKFLHPEMTSKYIEVTTIGCRDLKSPDALPLQKPFVSFSLNSYSHQEFDKHRTQHAECDTQSSSIPSPYNPCFKVERHLINCQIPIDPKFAPSLNISVRDRRFGGIIQPLIGSTFVSLHTRIKYGKDGKKNPHFKPAGRKKKSKEHPHVDSFKNRDNLAVCHNHAEMEAMDPGHGHEGPPMELDDSSQGYEEKKETHEQSHQSSSPSNEPQGVTVTKHDSVRYMGDVLQDDEDGAIRNVQQQVGNILTLGLKNFGKAINVDSELGISAITEQDTPEYMADREVCNGPLEECFQGLGCPFETFPIFRGRRLDGDESDVQVGLVKAIIRVLDDAHEEEPEVIKLLKKPNTVQVRLYVLKGQKLTPMDTSGKSDPYLLVKLGESEISRRNNYRPETLDPKFFETFEFVTPLPGPSQLNIEVYDRDLLGDDLIGKTVIDLEDRWYSLRWRQVGKVKNSSTDIRKPIETRHLWLPCSQHSQGHITLWLDIIPANKARKYPVINIEPAPKAKFEVRIIVWKTKNIPNGDPESLMSDMFVRIWIGNDLPQNTDVHWRAQRGIGNFNWRMKWAMELPREKEGENLLHIQVWDKDIFDENDCICESLLNFETIFANAARLHKPYNVFENLKSKRKQAENLRETTRIDDVSEVEGDFNAMNASTDSLKVTESTPLTQQAQSARVPKKAIKSPRATALTVSQKKKKIQDIRDQKKKKQRLHREPKSLWKRLTGAVGMGPPPGDSAWILLKPTPDYEDAINTSTGERIKQENYPQICISMEILPEHYAEALKCGFGRAEPNSFPYLAAPKGRPDPKQMWNPFYLATLFINRQLLLELCIPLVCCAIVLVLIFGGPYILELVEFVDLFPTWLRAAAFWCIILCCLFGCLCSHRSIIKTCHGVKTKKNKNK